MESLGLGGRVQVSQGAIERLSGSFHAESRGLIEGKGKGPTPTHFLVGEHTLDPA
jgi:hypothetical protein